MNIQAIFKLIVLGAAGFACPDLMAQNKVPVQQTTGTTANQKGLTVTGLIRDAASGKPLPAINISVPDFSAALTDDNGVFTIKVPDYRSTLYLSGEGFQSTEIALKGRHSVTASLYEESFSSVYDKANLPLGLKPLNQTVNAVKSINTEGNWHRPIETPDAYLQGKVAGLQPVLRSGTPNVGAYLLLEGYHSLYGTNQPLIVVDGMIFDTEDVGASLISGHYTNALATIDPKDIENITVIKDATSFYGTKAANGVIYITTAHAKQLATRIDAAVYGGMNFRPNSMPVMKANDYRVYLSEILKTQGWTADQIQQQPYMNDNPSNSGYYNYHNETNWQNKVMDNSASRNLYLKITGGDNVAKYALSVGYGKDAGIVKNTDLTKYNVRFNGDLNLSRRVTANTNLSYTYYEQNLSNQGLAVETNPIFLALIKAPFLQTNEVSDNGVLSPNIAETDTLGLSNPLAATNSIISNSKVYRFFGSVNFRYQLSKPFSIYSLVGVNANEVREQSFIPRKGISNDTLANAIADSRMSGQAKRLFVLYNDTYIDYNKTFHRIHHLQARIGVRFQNYKNEQDFAQGYNSPTDQFISVGQGANALRSTGGDYGEYNWANGYFGADYSLLSKYFLTYNMAVDASSRFGSNIPGALKIGGANCAILPSIGAAWLVSSENFMSNIKFLDQLKLRASFGVTGNDNIGNYTAKQLYTSQNLLGLQGLVRQTVGNPALQWETNTKYNAGIDAVLFKERLSVSVDAYYNNVSNMLVYEPVNTASGFDFVLTNNGAMRTRGVDASISGRIVNTPSFKWDVGVLLSTYTNRIKRLPGNSVFTKFGNATILTQTGATAGLFYGYKTNGVYSTDAEAAGVYRRIAGTLVPFKGGDVRFINTTNASGDTLTNGTRVTVIDESDRQNIGNPTPDFTGAFTNRIAYKNFSLEVLFTFSQGNKLFNGVRQSLESASNTYNQLQSVENRWRVPGQVTNIPKAMYGDPMGNNSFSDRWIEDGSFLRLRQLSFTYTLPLKKGSFIKSSSVYITGYNLLTFTKYLGYDPEFQAAESILARGIDVGLEPVYRSVIAGVRIGL